MQRHVTQPPKEADHLTCTGGTPRINVQYNVMAKYGLLNSYEC